VDAMILAAGLGTRLRPDTEHVPKALVEVGGSSMLERTTRRLIAVGCDRIVVNAHHHATLVREALGSLEAHYTGVEFLLSEEEESPLETGGGIANAAAMFRMDAAFYVHNVDVLSDLDLPVMYERHVDSGALATLAVWKREATRYLLFDADGLFGREDQRTGETTRGRNPNGPVERMAFGGIHVIDPRIFDRFEETGAFSIIDTYLRLAGAGEVILPFRAGGAEWFDLGSPERLARARAAYSD
jgi:NDP-sugar pyrophosphorylase family protein